MVDRTWLPPDWRANGGEGMNGGWIANLSDGSTVIETEPIPGELSPWQKLLQRCREEKHVVKGEVTGKDIEVSLAITGLQLQYGPITIMAMPNKECDGYFQAREVHRIIWRDVYLHMHGVGSVIEDKVYITWIQTTKDGQINIRSDVRPLETCKVHTTLQR